MTAWVTSSAFPSFAEYPMRTISQTGNDTGIWSSAASSWSGIRARRRSSHSIGPCPASSNRSIHAPGPVP